MMRQALAPLWILLLLAACGDAPDSDLVAYVQQIKQQGPSVSAAGKQEKKHELFAYRADSEGIRDPFASSRAEPIGNPGGGPKPEQHETSELEQVALESLVYMGSIEKRGRRVALVRDSAGRMHQVRVGDYLGQNHGKVVEFNQQQITLRELVPDGQGGWLPRTASLGLAR